MAFQYVKGPYSLEIYSIEPRSDILPQFQWGHISLTVHYQQGPYSLEIYSIEPRSDILPKFQWGHQYW
jgi:hypothetical protein